jgi:photosystem II stability/assembly factor-like uncharacterized protein
MKLKSILTLVLLAMLVASSAAVGAEDTDKNKNEIVSPKLMQALEYRMIGPNRGGRTSTVTGIASNPYTFYMGTSGGGVWKTTDAGQTWNNISDGFFECGSIGALAVAPSDENVIYVGTGETNPRGDIQTGMGVYKSTDGGKSWKHIGLRATAQIGRIVVNPNNADIVYVAALGHLFGPNAERGVYRSLDGGENWELVKHVSDKAGAVSLAMDVNNPRIIYAGFWQYQRLPWDSISGGEDGGVYKTVDGGDNWEKVENGLPTGIVGKIGVTVSPANSDRIWVSIEHENGGIFRSDDGGKTFNLSSDNRSLRTRAFYYSVIEADPVNENTLYVMNVRMHRSVDGGKTFTQVRTPHGDTHALWISPQDNNILISGNDGGACVSFNSGKTWSSQMNQPTAEFYRVETDNQYPYRVYGAQQDNSTISVNSQSMYRLGRGVADAYSVGGGEQGHIKVDPRDSNIVYAGNYDGYISRYDHKNGFSRAIKAWPEMGVGLPAKAYKYRFQMNAPILLNPHNPDEIYHASNVVHRSINGGKTWTVISPDLTRDDESKQEAPGGPITKDQAGGPENYCTIFAFEHSPLQEGLLWAGSDDGLVHISHNNGETWENITPPDMPEWATVNEIELSPYAAGRAFLAVQRYRMDDFKPYIFVTNDFGKTWKQLADTDNGIPANHAIRVVREDNVRKGLLYAGTEFGIFVSFDDGAHWQSMQLNLPHVQVADMMIKNNDLVLATHGRSFWILNDISPLRGFAADSKTDEPFVVKPLDAFYSEGFSASYYLPAVPEEEFSFVITTADGQELKTIEIKKAALENLKEGMNLVRWNTMGEAAGLDPSYPVWGYNAGPMAIPGDYKITLKMGEVEASQDFKILPYPGLEATTEQYQASYKMMNDVRDAIDLANDMVESIREIRTQVSGVAARAKKVDAGEDVEEAAKAIKEKLTAMEDELIQSKLQASQDILNFPPRLIHQLVRVINTVMESDIGPLDSSYERFEELKGQLDAVKVSFDAAVSEDVAAFNELMSSKAVPAIVISEEK